MCFYGKTNAGLGVFGAVSEVMQVKDPGGDRQTDAAAVFAGAGTIRAIEQLKQAGEIIGGDWRAFVLDGEPPAGRLAGQRDLDRCIGRGILRRIVQNRADGASERGLISLDADERLKLLLDRALTKPPGARINQSSDQ